MPRQRKPDVVAARRTFMAGRRTVKRGETFRAGHPLVEQYPREFVEWRVDNDFEQATAAPGEKRD